MSLSRFATEKITVKRAKLTGGRKEQANAEVVLQDLACTLPVPLSTFEANALQQEPMIKSVLAVANTYVIGLHDVKQGDIAEVAGVTYTVKSAQQWPQTRTQFTQVTMERINP